MKILLLNQDWFREELQAAGHEVMTCGIAGHFDVQLDAMLLHIETVMSRLPGGFRPDRIVVFDNSAPLMLSGLEETDIPTLFYSVDTHHHAELHRYFCNIFDCVLIAQKDYVPLFQAVGHSPEWMPLWASRVVDASPERRHDAVFVGNLNARLNPERVAFFDALRADVPVLCTTGEWWTIFPFSEIVINQTVKGDLNFRVFEAMMCGTLLLTERSGNGLIELFRDGEHLVAYEKNNVAAAADAIRSLLSNRRRCREIAAAGREEILGRHLPVHRATRLLEILSGLEKTPRRSRYLSALVNYASLASRLEKREPRSGLGGYVQALRALEHAVTLNEECTVDLAGVAIVAALRYDAASRSDAGSRLLARLADQQPASPVLRLAKVRTLLNRGEIEEARAVAAAFAPVETAEIFRQSEILVNELLSQLMV